MHTSIGLRMVKCGIFHLIQCVLRKRLTLTILCAIVIGIISLQVHWDQLVNYLLQPTLQTDDESPQLCINKSFLLSGMNICHLWLRCRDIQKDLVLTDEILGEGAVKHVKKGIWKGHNVAVSLLQHQDYISDFQHNLIMLQLFSRTPGAKSNKVVQLVGWCFEDTPVIVTEIHPFGSASSVHSILREYFADVDSVLLRFGLCTEFVQILDILHSHPGGPRVLCDANEPGKALSQILITDNLTLVLNDMDALPVVNRTSGKFIKCGHRELFGDFVAPEQLWPFDTLEYDDNLMPYYDEKVDIWKIPDVCKALLGNMKGISNLQLQLFNIHSQCKSKDAAKRPTAKEVFKAYERIYETLR